ncbi:MAG: hypothetical protein M9926_03535 [Lentimicrobium sp.]|uniref:hypothetical protein n=1 Tax=Lentimicrobium sp. TaxID=2034841 RepID=UPI0025CDC7F5|nr:hypothetical protein [Lentimicrobium sp.]MCO5255808.1 hypothetical protein [Lentimicrobium sp.]
MKLKSSYFFIPVLLFALRQLCSTPTYKQNKYKKARRSSRDCGCTIKPADRNVMLSYNEQK